MKKQSKKLETGQKFGRLTVIKLDHIQEYISPKRKEKHNFEYYLCKCDCGNECIVRKENLKHGNVKSCGCYCKEINSKIKSKHKLSNTKLYSIWGGIITRCYNSNDKAFKNYGGRGIIMCEEWRSDFKKFYDWAMNNGYEKGLSIDRIDNNKGYNPDNCRWINMKMQAKNRRSNHLITYNGETHCMSEWAEKLNIKPYILRNRITTYKWSIERAFKTPIKLIVAIG